MKYFSGSFAWSISLSLSLLCFVKGNAVESLSPKQIAVRFSRDCRERIETSDRLKRLFAVAEIKEIKKWDHDLLLAILVDLEQKLFTRCQQKESLVAVADLLKRTYLDRLGLSGAERTVEQNDLLFRGLAYPHSDLKDLQKKLAGQSKDTDPISLLKTVYGSGVFWVDGIVMIGPKAYVEKLVAFEKSFCESNQCVLWDSRFLFRVVIVSQKGLASYLPESGVLLLDDELFQRWRTLDKVVVLHELAHLAERRAKMVEAQDWVKEYASLSGWRKVKGKWKAQVVKSEKHWEDSLTQESQDSAFSILPDLVLDVAGESLEGFALHKSYEASIAQNDPGEELADHIALALIYSQRFCIGGKPRLPKKYDWIRTHVLPSLPPLSCS